MKRQSVVLNILTMLALASCTVLSPTAAPISHVYAFGDSYSDNGNFARLAAGGSSDLKWEGCCSNGPTAVEVLATRLNVELTDYAVGGAYSDADNFNPFPNTGALGQIEAFGNELDGQSADPAALYFVMVGANDFLKYVVWGMDGDMAVVTDHTADNIAAGVTQLAQLGAKRFLVVTSIDVASMPYVIFHNRVDQALEFQALMNSKVSGRLEELASQLEIEITAFDYIALSTKIRENPADYGLTNVIDACNGIAPPACDAPDQYFFWDNFHPTRRAHQIFGEAWAALFGA